MANFKIILLNILCGASINFAIVNLKKNKDSLVLNVPSEIQEERLKESSSTSFKITLFPTLIASIKEE
jgi:hypothetical protein